VDCLAIQDIICPRLIYEKCKGRVSDIYLIEASRILSETEGRG
jgi:hypothetical protein